MRRIKSLVPRSIKQALFPALNMYRQTSFYRNQVRQLGGRLGGLRLQGGFLSGFDDGSYENSLCNLIEKNVIGGMTCIDVGAHIGYISLLLGKLVGKNGRVIAFEAHPTNASYIKKNTFINHFEDRIMVENIAITDGHMNQVNLHERRGSSAEWKVGVVETIHDSTDLIVPATSLDSYIPKDMKVDFIKMDIEGAEALAIPGMRRVLTDSRPLLCIEFHNNVAWQARSILIDENYVFYDIQQKQWLSSVPKTYVYHVMLVPKERVHNLVV